MRSAARHAGGASLASVRSTAELQCAIYPALSPEVVLQEPAVRDTLAELAGSLPKPLVVALRTGERVPQKVLSRALDRGAADNPRLASSLAARHRAGCRCLAACCTGHQRGHGGRVRALSRRSSQTVESASFRCPSGMSKVRGRAGCLHGPCLSMPVRWRQDTPPQRTA